MIKPEYRCQKCHWYFKRDKPGPTQCPKCGYNYVDWLNHEKVIKSLGDYGRA
jgi:DNA polymerase II large subunit